MNNGWVDYAGLAADRKTLDRYLVAAESVSPQAGTPDEQIAFWINVYNAAVLRLVLDHYPIERDGIAGLRFPDQSVRHIPQVWERPAVRVNGEDYSLDRIAHEVLRREFEEPRVVFALSCGARGAPALRSEAYVAPRLGAQLESATRAFLSDPERGMRADPVERTLQVSRLFSWYAEDFVPGGPPLGPAAPDPGSAQAGAVLRFIRGHLEPSELIEADDFELDYLSFDWRLNGG